MPRLNPTALKNLANVLGFQLTWWALVLSASRGIEYVGWAVAVLFLLTHFVFVVPRPQLLSEKAFVLLTGALGWSLEHLLQLLGVVRFETHPYAPAWLLFIWLGFAATLRHSFRGVLSNPWLAAALGAVFGPVSYLAGVPFGLLTFPSPSIGVAAYALLWGLGLFLYSWRTRRPSAAN